MISITDLTRRSRMKKRVNNGINRPSIIRCYKDLMVQHLVQTEGLDPTRAGAMVDEAISKDLVDPRVCAVESPSVGNTKTVYSTLGQTIKKHSKDIVTPSGSMYMSKRVKEAFLAKLIDDGLALRKAIKKEMFAAAADGDKLLTKQKHYGQSSVKIKLNSLPGGMGSPHNIFYDKGGYNAITSSARALIAQSYVTAETVMGGNWPWFNQEEILNHIYTVAVRCPSKDEINTVMGAYNIKPVTREMLFEFMLKTVKQYKPKEELLLAKKALVGTEDHVIQFLYYMHNLRHLLWGNEDVFKPIMRDILSIPPDLSTEGIEPGDMWKTDEDLIAVVFTVMAEEISGIKPKDLVKEHPELAKRCAAIGQRMQGLLDLIEPLFEMFIYTDVNTAQVLTRTTMYRNTVIISDTDSVIYTSKDWVNWYVGHLDKIVAESFDIAALITYFLTRAVADTMAKFSIGQGATGESVQIMQMKNEYLYPTLILYDAKKVYAGVIKVQEGVVLPEPKVDLKGGAIRSSNVAKDSRDFTQDLIVEHILKPSADGKISAMALIKRVVEFEHRIINSLKAGHTEFLGRQSIKTMDSYDNPSSSAWAYGEAWNAIFGGKYDPIQPPDKVPLVKLKAMPVGFLDLVKEMDPEIYTSMTDYIAKHGKLPTAIGMSPITPRIPPELIELADIRHVVYSNIKPIYLTLERLGISVGFEKQQLLLSDVYLI